MLRLLVVLELEVWIFWVLEGDDGDDIERLDWREKGGIEGAFHNHALSLFFTYTQRRCQVRV